jgi:Uma2 family endonuclease
MALKLYTVAEYETFLKRPENQDCIYELINGEIVPMSPSVPHGESAHLLSLRMGIYNLKAKVGRILIEVRYRMPGDEHNSHIPDLSFIAGMDTELPESGAVPRMPDLAVEIKSPEDSEPKMRAKATYYLKNGSKLVWLLFTDRKTIEVHRPNAEPITLTETDTLDGGDVLPGFTVAVRDLFSK